MNIRSLLDWFRRTPPPSHTLVVMRLADMHRVHPDQIVDRCSQCNAIVAVYPSGQRIMKEFPTIKLICQVCDDTPADGVVYLVAPGAELDASQSQDVEKNA